MAGYLSVTLGKIPKPDELGYEVREERVIEPIEDPGPERMHFEKHTFLSKLVELWVAIEKASGNELVKDSYHKGWEDGKEHVVERQRPRFEDNFTREGVLERILYSNG